MKKSLSIAAAFLCFAIGSISAQDFELTLSASPDVDEIFSSTLVRYTLTSTQVCDELTLYLDGVSIKSSQNVASINNGKTYNIPGHTYEIKGVGTLNGVTKEVTRTLQYYVHEETKDYPGGVPQMGAVRNNDGSVTFCIAAPKSTSVLLIGSWNDYAEIKDQIMYSCEYNGNKYFWQTVDGLKENTDYMYYYNVDGKKVGDPYARLVLDPNNDKYISADVYPNLPAYPTDKIAASSNVCLAVYNSNHDGHYDWKVENFKGVDKSMLVIYELLIRDFTGTEGAARGEGTIAGVMDKLDYIQSLGVNAIEIMPIMEFDGNNSWGYNPNFYFAPDKAYGTPDDYRRLFDEIHQRGMAVILDVVFNQTAGLHPWYMMYAAKENPFYNASAPHSYSVLNDWNQDNELVQQQFKDVLQYWMKEYKVDGFRFDLVKGLGSNASYKATYNASTNTWSGVTEAKTNAYNASRVARMKEFYDAMLEVNPNAYCVNENLAGAQEENEMAASGELNWANINNASCQFAMGYSSDANTGRFYAVSDSRTWGSTVSYAESHDEERMAYKIAQWGLEGIKDVPEIATRRLGSVAAMMLMAPGAHMIWQFQEFGADQTTKDASGSNNTSPKKVIWSYLDNPYNAGLKDTYAQLIAVRNNNPELFVNQVATTQVRCSSTSVRTITLQTEDKSLYLVVNPAPLLSNTTNWTGVMPDPASLTIYGYREGEQLQVLAKSYNTDPVVEGNKVTLEPGAFVVLGTMNLSETPEIIGDINAKPAAYGADGRIVIIGEYKNAEVYTLSGQRVGSLSVAPGVYIVNVDGNVSKVIVR